MLGVMEYGIGVVGRSMGSPVCFIGFVGDEFRDRPARTKGDISFFDYPCVLSYGFYSLSSIFTCT